MFKAGLVLSTLLGFLLHTFPLCAAPTNTWTKPTSGNWEESYWSAGILPSMNFGAIEFRNPGFKALAIAPSTTTNYPAPRAPPPAQRCGLSGHQKCPRGSPPQFAQPTAPKLRGACCPAKRRG